MERYFWLAQLMLFTGASLRFGIALIPLAAFMEILSWFLGGVPYRKASHYLLHLALYALSASVAMLAVVRTGFGFHVYFVDNAWWFALAMLAIGLILTSLQRTAPLSWTDRGLQFALLCLAAYLILVVPYLRAQTRWLSWLFFLGPSLFIAYLPPLIRALSAGDADAIAVTRVLWFLLAPAMAIFHATYHFGLTILTSFDAGAEFYPIVVVYRGILPVFLAVFLYTVWIQFRAVGHTLLPAGKAWAGLIGGYAGAVLAAAMLWFGVTIFDTLAL